MDELKAQVAKLETSVAVLQATVPTKEDLHKEILSATSRFVGWMFLLLTLYSGIMLAIKLLWH